MNSNWPNHRRMVYAAAALQGMLGSAPLCDRTKVNKTTWARAAFAFADAMMRAERRKKK